MAALTVNTIVAGTGKVDVDSLYESAAGGGDTVVYDPKVFLVVKNGDSSPTTVTITAQSASGTLSGFGTVTKANETYVIAAGDTCIIGHLEQAFRNASGLIAISYSSVTSLSIAAFKMNTLTA